MVFNRLGGASAALLMLSLTGLAPPPEPATAPAVAPALASSGARIVIGQPAPPFKLKTFAHEEVSLADLRGRVVVINLWATWCVPCKAEIPMMDAYYRANRDKGLRIFGVQTEDSVLPFRLEAVQKALAYPLTLQFRGAAYKKMDAVPTSYVIDRAGIVRYAESGAFNQREFDAVLRPLLAEKPPADANPAY